jgi:hypothetical protein
MKISTFFTDILGANLKNLRWSWGAADPMTNRIFLRVWKDQIEMQKNGEQVLVSINRPGRRSHGFSERQLHINQIRNGAEGFGVVCTAVNPDTLKDRTIASFDDITLLKLGAFRKKSGRIYAQIDARVPADLVMRQPTAESTLTVDLRELVNRKIDSTTKEALVSARVGQGNFRTQVLKIWGHRCCVTSSRILDVIRASHIKPWRNSSDKERVDPANGLPLVASLDALFDAGLISFESSGRLIVSSRLNAAEQQLFGIKEKSLIKIPSIKTAEYLTYHRSNVFHK